jgi:hypothetical protein
MLRSPGTAKIMVTDKKAKHTSTGARPAQIAWAKLRVLRAGAAIASTKLWS